MSDYEFVTIWRFHAPLQGVWNEIYHSENWPQWWKGVESVVELRKGDENSIGSLRRYTWKSALPYRLTFDMQTTRVEKLLLIEGTAAGELSGTGVWQFSQAEGLTVVRYDWNVRATKRWMNLLAPFARPLFSWNHDVVMRWGAESLAKRLGVRMVD